MHTIETAPPAGPATLAWDVETSACGDVRFVRRRGLAEPRPASWREDLAALLATLPGTAAVGAKRIGRDGTIISMGEFVVHPKGLHAFGRGEPAAAFRFPEEVDAIAGGVVAVRRDAFDAAGGMTRLAGPSGLLELTLALRRDAGRVIVAAHVEVEDDLPAPLDDDARRAFTEAWGFDPAAPDMDAIRTRYAGTGLLWQPRLHAPPLPFDKYADRAGLHWTSYDSVPIFRQRADHLVAALSKTAGGPRVLDLGCGDGLYANLLAARGYEVTGVDVEALAIDIARAETERRAGSAPHPRFLLADGGDLPLSDASFDVVAMLDVVEHLPNPVRVLGEATRVLAPGGHLLLTTPAWCHGAWNDHVYHVTEFTRDEIVALVEGATAMPVVATGKIGGTYRDVIVIAKKDATERRSDEATKG